MVCTFVVDSVLYQRKQALKHKARFYKQLLIFDVDTASNLNLPLLSHNISFSLVDLGK